MNSRKKIWIILSCIVLILGSFGYGYYSTLKNMADEVPQLKPGARINVKNDIQSVTDNEEGVNMFPSEDRVTPSTVLIEVIESINTGSRVENQSEVPEEIINFTKEQVLDYFREYDSIEFNTEKIMAIKRVPYLPNRFVVKLEDKYIRVYETDTDGKAVIMKDFPEILSKNKDSDLIKGIEVETLDEVWQRIGDYE